jgi:bacteriorhodopsin
MSDSLNLWITLGVFFLSSVMIVLLVRLERRPRAKLEPRLIPTTPLILIFAFIGLLALVHLANLYGIHTGNRTRY